VDSSDFIEFDAEVEDCVDFDDNDDDDDDGLVA
jgi:hypothetical protein